MTKIRKVKKKKKYQYEVNRKRMNKKRLPKLERHGNVGYKEKNVAVSKAWDSLSSSQKNFKKMGLVYDVNKTIKYMNKSDAHDVTISSVKKPKNTAFIQELEDVEATSKGKKFRFSEDQVNFLTYLLDKYNDDYKAMSRDRKNYLQCTWKQLRYKINLFKSIPEHYNEYLKKKKKEEHN